MRNLPKFFLIAVFFASCAQVVMPSGGPKDVTPPKVVSYFPDSAATNFTGHTITLRFDEYIQLSDLNNQLIVSPPLNTQPDVNVHNKDLKIDIHDTLLPNTTYTISFGNAIKDITEGNILEDFRYVFSTGPMIDSLKLSGKVTNALNQNGEKGILVMLYTAAGDSVPYKQRPYYFTKTKPDGTFHFTNLKAGQYKVFALDDANSNYRYDNAAERVAFSNDLLSLSKNNDSLQLRLFKEEPSKQKRLALSQPFPGKIILSYARPLTHPLVKTGADFGSHASIEISPGKDTVVVWYKDAGFDSTQIVVNDDQTVVDSAMVHLKKSSAAKIQRSGVDLNSRKLQLSSNIPNGGAFDLGKLPVIASNNPIADFDAGKIVVMKGSDTLKMKPQQTDDHHHVTLDAQLTEDSSYTLTVLPGAFTDFFGQKNDTLKFSFHIRPASYYGNFSMKLKAARSGNFIFQLVDDKNTVVREKKLSNDTVVSFDKIPPGMYRARLISDSNNDGKWTTGNYLQHQQPEEVKYFPLPVNMRAGWDMDLEWK